MVEDEEALDLLDLGVLGVGLVELALDERAHLVVLGERGERGVLDAVLLGPRHDLLLVEGDEHDGVRTPVAVHDGLRDPARLLEVVLEVGRREVLAAGGDDDVLLAARDVDVAVIVDGAEVAGVQPPVDDGAEARVVVAVVALEDVVALEEQLAVVGDPRLDAGQHAPDRAEAVVLDRRVGGHRGRLRHPVALEDGDAAAVEELEDLLGDRRRAADGLAHAPAEDRAHVLEQLLLGGFEGCEQLGRDLLAADLQVADPHAELRGRLHLLPDLGRL